MKGGGLLAMVSQRLFWWAGDGSPLRKMRRREGGGDVAVDDGAMASNVNGLTRYFPCQGQ